MQNEVYADLLFLVNFSMDFLCFYICARLLHRPLCLWRGVLASALGGLYAVGVLLVSVGKTTSLLLDMAVCCLLCAVAMATRGDRFRSVLWASGLYMIVSALLGGVMTLLFSKLNEMPGLDREAVFDGVSAWVFLGMALASSALTWLWSRGFRRTSGCRRVTVIVENQGRRAELHGIFDSGNMLKDPIGGKTVIPSSISGLGCVVPPMLARVARAKRMVKEVEGLPPELIGRVRLVPARSATGDCLMLSWRPDHVYLREEGGKEEREINALIAPNVHLERGEIAALVPAELMSI